MTKQHTPGPWRMEVSPVRGTLCVVSDEAWICGELDNPNTPLETGEAQANARLIAAAPDMLAAIRTTICPGGGWTGIQDGVVPTVDACCAGGHCGCDLGDAFKKATGN